MTTVDQVHPAQHHRGAGLFALLGAIVIGLGVLFGATAGVGAIWGAVSPSGHATATGGSPAASAAPKSPAANTLAAQKPVAPESVSLAIQTGKQDGKPGWPRYVPADITLTKGAKVTLTITNNDDGTAPLPSSMATYDNVQGGTETVDGTPVTSEPNAQVAHTFTVPELGVNVVIPAAPTGGTNTIVFTFTPKKSGSFTWHCFAPCGSGSDGMTGAMATSGWMEGTVTVH